MTTGGSFSPVADVLDSERPVDRLAGNPARLPAAVDTGHMIAFDPARLATNALTNREAVIRWVSK